MDPRSNGTKIGTSCVLCEKAAKATASLQHSRTGRKIVVRLCLDCYGDVMEPATVRLRDRTVDAIWERRGGPEGPSD